MNLIKKNNFQQQKKLFVNVLIAAVFHISNILQQLILLHTAVHGIDCRVTAVVSECDCSTAGWTRTLQVTARIKTLTEEDTHCSCLLTILLENIRLQILVSEQVSDRIYHESDLWNCFTQVLSTLIH